MAGAAALTVVFLAIILVLSLVQSRLIDKKVHYR
jgi:preprotein translocase subunit SecG